MNAPYSKEIIDYIADDMVVDPSYVEKDFYATKILGMLSGFSSFGHNIIFSGGTSLSKGYNLIKRFSEDLDFEIDAAVAITQSERRTIRHNFLDIIAAIPDFEIIESYAENGGKKQTISVKYPHLYPIPGNLRDNLKIELFFEPTELSTEECIINSFISTYTKQNPENIKITCNNPLNIMADKFSALTWRVFDGKESFDYTIMRHLHDLYAINRKYGNNTQLKKQVIDNFTKKDAQRVRVDNFFDLLKEVNNMLAKDPIYKKAYEKFVDSMSYAKDSERISFDTALQEFHNLSTIFIKGSD